MRVLNSLLGHFGMRSSINIGPLQHRNSSTSSHSYIIIKVPSRLEPHHLRSKKLPMPSNRPKEHHILQTFDGCEMRHIVQRQACIPIPIEHIVELVDFLFFRINHQRPKARQSSELLHVFFGRWLSSRPAPNNVSNVTELIVRQIFEQLQESVVVGKIEDVLRVIAGKGLFVNLLADAQERQVAFEINSEEGFGSSTRLSLIHI